MSCGAGGDAVALVRVVRPELSYREACELVREVCAMSAGRADAEEGPRHAEPPPRLSIPAAALLHDLWEVIREAQPTPLLRQWCESRAIDPHAAYAAGARDWSPVIDQLRSVVRASVPAAIELGLMKDLTEAGRPGVHVWGPLRRGRGEARPIMGIGIPLWIRGMSIPAAYRWRCVPPIQGVHGQVKSLAQWAGSTSVSSHGIMALMPPRGSASTLIITEGEPDFLTWCSWAQADPAVGVLGITGTLWRWHMGAWLHGVQRLVVATHRSPASEKALQRIRLQALQQGVPAVVDARVPEAADWNDRAMRGWAPGGEHGR